MKFYQFSKWIQISCVAAIATNGQPTAENASGVDLTAGPDLGEGWRSLKFQDTLSAGAATAVALKIASDPRVASVELDRHLMPASVSTKPSKAALAALKPASSVRSLKVVDAWSSSTMFRGIEIILKGRDPRDAWAFVQRI